jgi:hypothetical protein
MAVSVPSLVDVFFIKLRDMVLNEHLHQVKRFQLAHMDSSLIDAGQVVLVILIDVDDCSLILGIRAVNVVPLALLFIVACEHHETLLHL